MHALSKDERGMLKTDVCELRREDKPAVMLQSHPEQSSIFYNILKSNQGSRAELK